METSTWFTEIAAQEAGFKLPVALTSAVWADCVAWTDDDSRKKPFQDQPGRLWDVLYMACHAIRTSRISSDWLFFSSTGYREMVKH